VEWDIIFAKNKSMNAIRIYAEVKDHEIRLKLPKSVKTRRVEVIIIPYEEEPVPNESAITDLQRLLLEAPDMSDETYSAIIEKRKALNRWK
jgi:hypothetical protein